MSFGVCFRQERKQWMQDQWSFVFSNFGLDAPWIWERGCTEDRDFEIYQTVTPISTAAELPLDHELVVLAHPEGKYIKGTESLVTFQHPENAIYLFGGSHDVLSDEDDLGGRTPDHLIYIPSGELEMYAFMAASITLYDRMVKRG